MLSGLILAAIGVAGVILALDEEDKALIRPLLIEVLKKRAKRLTPEHQLIAVLASIMIKKAQAIMEIREQNEILTERILEAIQEEKSLAREEEVEQAQAQGKQTAFAEEGEWPEQGEEAQTTFVERREAPDPISDADTDLMLPADLVESYQQAQEALPGSADG